MPPKPRGQPPKKHHIITGLQNSSSLSTVLSVMYIIFDQSSAHASLPPDTLKAFEINKLDGEKHCKQHNMVIPESNPVAEHCGKAQKMTLENGQPKGMQRVLEEHGSMSPNYLLNAHQYALLRTPITAWLFY